MIYNNNNNDNDNNNDDNNNNNNNDIRDCRATLRLGALLVTHYCGGGGHKTPIFITL